MCDKFIQPGKESWYHQTIDDMYPIFDKVRSTYPNLETKYSSIFETFDKIKQSWFSDIEAFTEEYRKLIPQSK